MRTFLLALAVGASASLAATPAAAQFYPQRYGYSGDGYNGYAENRGYADPSGLEQRIYNVLRSLDGVRPDQRGQVRAEALSLERQLRFAARNGLSQYEGHAFDVRIYQLERHMASAAMNGGYGYQSYNGYYQGGGHGRWHHDDGDDHDDD
ncbi:MAG TPA: hypothetical protein VNR68_09090 [Sphingomicrobium sp.]|nr:hypothetical protein [Sphingomicrobium sp.]